MIRLASISLSVLACWNAALFAQGWVAPAITRETPPTGSFAPGFDPALLGLEICQLQAIPNPLPRTPGETLIFVSLCGGAPIPGTANHTIGSGTYQPTTGAVNWDPFGMQPVGVLGSEFSFRVNDVAGVDASGVHHDLGTVAVWDEGRFSNPRITTRSSLASPWNPSRPLFVGAASGYLDSSLALLDGILHYCFTSGGLFAAPLDVATGTVDLSRARQLASDESPALHNGQAPFGHSPIPLTGADGETEAFAFHNATSGFSRLFFQARTRAANGTRVGNPDPAVFPLTMQGTSFQNNAGQPGPQRHLPRSEFAYGIPRAPRGYVPAPRG